MKKWSLYQRIAGLNILLVLLATVIPGTIFYQEEPPSISLFKVIVSLAIALAFAIPVSSWQTGKISGYANDLRIKQDRTRRLEKFAAVSSLGAGIADKIRNPLTSIKGFTYLLQNQLNAGDRTQGYTNIILHEVTKIEKVINNFLLLARPPFPITNPVNINILVDELLPILVRRAVLNNVILNTGYDEQLPLVEGDPIQLKYVITNLAANAIDAMPNGGYLHIESKLAGGNCIITIADTGNGIPKDHMEKIAEPFYTTKPDCLGLGLAISQQIVVNHGGILDIETSEGKGTKLKIVLPAVRGNERKEPA